MRINCANVNGSYTAWMLRNARAKKKKRVRWNRHGIGKSNRNRLNLWPLTQGLIIKDPLPDFPLLFRELPQMFPLILGKFPFSRCWRVIRFFGGYFPLRAFRKLRRKRQQGNKNGGIFQIGDIKISPRTGLWMIFLVVYLVDVYSPSPSSSPIFFSCRLCSFN